MGVRNETCTLARKHEKSWKKTVQDISATYPGSLAVTSSSQSNKPVLGPVQSESAPASDPHAASMAWNYTPAARALPTGTKLQSGIVLRRPNTPASSPADAHDTSRSSTVRRPTVPKRSAVSQTRPQSCGGPGRWHRARPAAAARSGDGGEARPALGIIAVLVGKLPVIVPVPPSSERSLNWDLGLCY